ncbi:MAG: hypothetical protein ACR2NA_05500 [Solirubrobacterales bacterium]
MAETAISRRIIERIAIDAIRQVSHSRISGDGGVRAIADGRGAYELAIDVVVELEALPTAADDLRTSIRASAERHGLADHMGDIDVTVVDLREPEPGRR